MSQSLIFFGSDQYSAVALQTILQGVLPGVSRKVSVVTDRQPGGSPVEHLARSHNLEFTYYPTTPEEKIVFNGLMVKWSTSPQGGCNGPIPLGLCASFDHLIPKDVISQFGGRLYNLHPSLLPQYRNVSPVQYAIAMGDKETGITLFRISPGIDDGEIIAQVTEPILATDTTPTLTTRLFQKGAALFLDALPDCKVTNLAKTMGPLIFTHRLNRDSGYIEWSILEQLLANKLVSPGDTKNELLALRLNKIKSSGLIIDNWLLVINDLIRSLYPWPGVWSLVPTKKGELRISLESVTPEVTLKLAGKPKPISYADFKKYYLL
ncbi:MAG: formyltransferase family protein [Microgenomates group bacterium]